MSSFTKVALPLLLGLATFAACSKSKDNNNNSSGTAGTGGTAVLKVLPQHHLLSRNIDTCAVYIKYNAVDLPSTFDDTAICHFQDTTAIAIFTGLKNGNYYLYGRGYDTSIHQPIFGGISCSITTQGDTTLVYLPVSEE